MAPLAPNLTFSTGDIHSPRDDLPPPGQLLFITDDLASRGDFMVYSALISHFKKPQAGRAVVVTSRDVHHWRSISLKVNLNLNSHFASERLKFVNLPVNDIFLLDDSTTSDQDKCPIVTLFHAIKSALGDSGEDEKGRDALIVIDDLAILEWIGAEEVKIVRFLRAVRSLSRSANASVVVLYHSLDNSLNNIIRYLLSWAQCHLRVSALTSGLSGAVSGEVWWQAGMATTDPNFVTRPKSQALHYKLLESGPTFFDRGTGGGIL